MNRKIVVVGLAAAALSAQAPSTAPVEDGYVRRALITARGLAPSMKVKTLAQTGRSFEVTMRKGDEIAAGLTEFAEQNHIKLAHFTGVGAIDSGLFGWFDPQKRAYKKIVVDQEAEVVAFAGNIAVENGKPFVHAHCVVALPDGSTKGGHLIEGHVSLEMQIFVTDDSEAEEAGKK
jgi:predicted DNA-binding protein with PD1-like motif